MGADCGGTNGARPNADSIMKGGLADRAQMILAGHCRRAAACALSGDAATSGAGYAVSGEVIGILLEVANAA
ncbi:hypothetical protein EGT67_14185 [Prescottella agglutinans]|uniref:Uncharacterized protein n=1 Tax=Prescottella agglutinans TaxID=1644129 RepID=A0A3S3E9W1_9NOCA|nr:hypothetical protein EGT67_14185 [Prescottella agglutinans]